MLEPSEVAAMREVSKSFKVLMGDENYWLDQITALVMLHPDLADLDKGEQESAYFWYRRCHLIVYDAQVLALKHKAGEYPYLKLYGTIEALYFTPFSPLRFPMPRGFIAELIDFMAKSKLYSDEFKDAALLFEDSKSGTDAAFRRIVSAVVAQTRVACPPSKPTYDLDKLVTLLSGTYQPSATKGAEPVEIAPPSRRALDTLQRRLGRATLAMSRADERVAKLEADNARLRAVIKEKDKVIAALAAEIVDLKARNRYLQGELDAERRTTRVLEKRPTREELVDVNQKLAVERKASRAAGRQIAAMKKERTLLRRMLTVADNNFEAAEAALEASKAAAATSKSAELKARAEADARELAAAAQVAAARLEASEWMEEALDEAVAAEVEKRGLLTPQEMLELARQQSRDGEFTDPIRSITGIVMASECAGSKSTTFRPDNASGKGRVSIYKKVIQSMKKSHLLSSTQLWRRSKDLMAEIHRVGGSAEASVVQTTHLINANNAFFKNALLHSRLAPATPMNLEQWAELGTQVSGCLGDQIRTFFRNTCGNKFPTKSAIKAHYANSHFDFHTFPYEAVDLIESKEKQDDGSIKVKVTKKYTYGVCGSVKSVGDVAVRMLQHHYTNGNIAYPTNIPAGFVPFQICLDAGAGTTKVILKLNIVKNSDSVKNLVLLGILSKAKDTYAAMAVAFKSIFDDFNCINQEGLWVLIGWRPALPLDHSIELFGPDLKLQLRKR